MSHCCGTQHVSKMYRQTHLKYRGLCGLALGWLQADEVQHLLQVLQPVLEQLQKLIELQLTGMVCVILGEQLVQLLRSRERLPNPESTLLDCMQSMAKSCSHTMHEASCGVILCGTHALVMLSKQQCLFMGHECIANLQVQTTTCTEPAHDKVQINSNCTCE